MSSEEESGMITALLLAAPPPTFESEVVIHTAGSGWDDLKGLALLAFITSPIWYPLFALR
jgi:hypothetical protein